MKVLSIENNSGTISSAIVEMTYEELRILAELSGSPVFKGYYGIGKPGLIKEKGEIVSLKDAAKELERLQGNERPLRLMREALAAFTEKGEVAS